MEEMIDVVDEEENIIRKATRKEVRANGLLHKVTRVIVLNKEGNLLAQKRSMSKDIYPGLWDIGVAETVKSGETYEQAAARGLSEELGIIIMPSSQLKSSFMLKAEFRSPNHNVNYAVYKCQYDNRIRMQKDEISEVKFLTVSEAETLMKKNLLSPGACVTLRKYMESIKK